MLTRLIEVVSPQSREGVPVRGRDPDCGRAPHRQVANRVRNLSRGTAGELDLLVREPALVEEDDALVLEPQDPVRLQHAPTACLCQT